MQNDHLVHVDYKLDNMVATADGKEFHHIDTEDALTFPKPGDTRTLVELKANLRLLGNTTAAYVPMTLQEKMGTLYREMMDTTDRKMFLEKSKEMEQLAGQLAAFQMGATLLSVSTNRSIRQFTGTDEHPTSVNESFVREALKLEGNYILTNDLANLIVKLTRLPPQITVKEALKELKRIEKSQNK